MFSHPAAVLGFVVAAVGWFMLLSGGGSGAAILGRDVVNLHTVWVGQALIMSGGALIVGGVVAGGASWIRQALLFHPQIAANAGAADEAEKARKKAEWAYINTGKKAKPAADDSDDVVTAERRLAELQMKR